jgi:hypothetical protein
MQIMDTVTDEGDTPSDATFGLTVVATTLVSLTGFFDSLIYGWDRKLWDAVVALLFCRQRHPPRVCLLPEKGTKGSINRRQDRADGVEPTEETLAFSD